MCHKTQIKSNQTIIFAWVTISNYKEIVIVMSEMVNTCNINITFVKNIYYNSWNWLARE